MRHFPRTFLPALTLMVLMGCAANQSIYEAPLKDVGALSGRPRHTWQIQEISYHELENLRPGERPAPDSDEAGLWMLMDRAESRLKTSGHLVRAEKLNQYLKTVACRLVPEYCQDIRIYLLRIPVFNAAMAPNGAMQIWTGLLLRVHNEAQLASVMAHEFAHYLRRHTLQMMQDVIDKTAALVFVRLASAVAGVPQAGDIIQVLTLTSIQAFSRDHEREADGYGMALMSRAGYDPREIAKIWRRIIEEREAAEDRPTVPVFLATHPSSEERYEALAALGDRVRSRGGVFESGEERYRARVLPHWFEYLEDELDLRQFAATEYLLDSLSQSGMDPAAVHFFRGELYRLRGDAGDHERALVEYEAAARSGSVLGGGSATGNLYRAMGLLCLKTGRREEAFKAFRRYLDECPACPDKEMILHMIDDGEG